MRKPFFQKFQRQRPGGWEKEAPKYNKLVGEGGHYYHEHVVLPGVLKLLKLNASDKLLDLGCGQGVLSRAIPKEITYLGVDSSKSLISTAKALSKNSMHNFMEASATKPLPKVVPADFTKSAIILALQNMERGEAAIQNASSHLQAGGKLLIVLNHPSFRIPRQSGWGEHPNKLQYRWITRYMSDLKIPITMHPGERNSATTISFHHPISFYVNTLNASGFNVARMEEWTSDRESQGKQSKMENRARSEFPLFLAILAEKK